MASGAVHTSRQVRGVPTRCRVGAVGLRSCLSKVSDSDDGQGARLMGQLVFIDTTTDIKVLALLYFDLRGRGD